MGVQPLSNDGLVVGLVVAVEDDAPALDELSHDDPLADERPSFHESVRSSSGEEQASAGWSRQARVSLLGQEGQESAEDAAVRGQAEEFGARRPGDADVAVGGEMAQPHERLVRIVEGDDVDAGRDDHPGQRRHEPVLRGPLVALLPESRSLADVRQAEFESTSRRGRSTRLSARPPLHGADHIVRPAQPETLVDEAADQLVAGIVGQRQPVSAFDHPVAECRAQAGEIGPGMPAQSRA